MLKQGNKISTFPEIFTNFYEIHFLTLRRFHFTLSDFINLLQTNTCKDPTNDTQFYKL